MRYRKRHSRRGRRSFGRKRRGMRVRGLKIGYRM